MIKISTHLTHIVLSPGLTQEIKQKFTKESIADKFNRCDHGLGCSRCDRGLAYPTTSLLNELLSEEQFKAIRDHMLNALYQNSESRCTIS